VLDRKRLAAYYGQNDELHLTFDFLLLHAPLRAGALRPLLQHAFWPALAGSNHDAGRLATRWAADDPDLTRCALLLLVLLRGTPVLYYGDELGLPALPIPQADRRDRGFDAEGLDSRDGSRTPMTWRAGRGAGFCPPGTRPWLPIGPHADRLSVAAQRADPTSTLAFCRALLALRRAHPELRTGDLEVIDPPQPDLLGWRRGQRFEAWLNLGSRPLPLPTTSAVATSTHPNAHADGTLAPRTGVVFDHACPPR
jgi:alpha-glucosidase